MCLAPKIFPLAQYCSLITLVTCYCDSFLKRRSLLITLVDRQPAGQGLTTSRQESRQGCGSVFPTSPGEGGRSGRQTSQRGRCPYTNIQEWDFGHLKTAAAGQHCWERRAGWSSTMPSGTMGATAQRPASSQHTNAYIGCCCTSS